MALTDRAIIKERQVGQAQAYGLASSATDGIAAVHTRSRDCLKVGTENAATAVAETVMFTVNRKSQFKTAKLLTNSGITANATHYLHLTVQKRTAGAASVLIASWNTHTSAQGAITALVPASLSVVANSDSTTLAAGDILTYTVVKESLGRLLDQPSVITVDLEES